MAQSPRTSLLQTAPLRRSTADVRGHRAPTWFIPLAAIVVLAAIVAGVLMGCQEDSQQEASPVEPAREDGVKTIEDAQAAGGATAQGAVDVQTAFAAYSWDELQGIAREIESSGSEEAALDVARKYSLVNGEGKLTGDCKPLELADGSAAAVQIAGFYHDDKADGTGKAGITFIMRDCLPEKQCMNASGNNAGGWYLSDLRAGIGETVGGQLPADVVDKMVPVRKATNNIGTTEDASSITLNDDPLWLFSKTELCGTIENEVYTVLLGAEGSQYQLFADGGVTDKQPSDLLAKRNGVDDCVWWTRTPCPDGNTGVGYFVVLKDGSTDDFSYFADTNYGVVPGFCI